MTTMPTDTGQQSRKCGWQAGVVSDSRRHVQVPPQGRYTPRIARGDQSHSVLASYRQPACATREREVLLVVSHPVTTCVEREPPA